ncbi:hypothetical protein ACWCQ3_40940, partial [Streptomyces sp. NPDC001966]
MSLFPRARREAGGPGDCAVPQEAGATRRVSAGARSVAAGGAITGSALGDNSRVTYIEKQYVAEAGVPVGWPVVVGTVPVLASAFQPREVLRQAVDEARGHGRSVV